MAKLHKHPYYVRMRPHWKRYRDLYVGDHDTLVTEYLWKHENEKKAEGAELLKTRQERTRYLNLQEIHISVLRSLFFRKDGAPDEALEALLETELDDIDREGNSLQRFIASKVFINYLNIGCVCLIADAPQGQAPNAAAERQLGFRPYLKNIDPLDVEDWTFERQNPARLNRLNMLRYVYLVDVPRTETDEPLQIPYSDAYVWTEKGVVINRYRGEEIKPGEPVDTSGEWELEKKIPLTLKEIPAVLWHGESWMKDASEEILRHFNLRSALDNINYYQGYQKLFIKAGAAMSDDQKRALSEYIMGLLADGQDVIMVPPIDPVGLEKAVGQALDNAFKMALNQLRSLPADARVVMSAESAQEQRRDTINLVVEAVGELQGIVNQALKHYAAFKDAKYIETPFEGGYNLSTEIAAENMQDLINRYVALGDALRSNPEWEKAHLEKIIRAEEYQAEAEEAILQALKPREMMQQPARPDVLGDLLGPR